MLSELSIKNFAIIDDLRIVFFDGLTIISGETGAGKSIIIDAVNLLLGSRASANLIRAGCKAAELEAHFEVAPGSITGQIMTAHGFDPAEGLLIRRIISHSNRHKIYINGRLATIQMLSSVTENLASISGQHVHQGLLKEDLQLMTLDQFGGLLSLRKSVFQCFHEFIPLIQQRKELCHLKERQAAQVELLQFQRKEIISASIQPGEDETLSQERMRLKNGEQLYQTVLDCIETLYDTPGSIIERLTEVKKNLNKASRIDAGLSEKVENIDGTVYYIEDLAGELRTYLQNIQLDQKQLEDIEERLDILQKLKRKYGGSLDSILARLESIEKDLFKIENISEKIEAVESQLKGLYDQLAKLAIRLSGARKKTAKKLAEKVENELAGLKMPHTKFSISLRSLPVSSNTDPYLITNGKMISETGIDTATFMIAPNVGEELKPLASIASGGELSRVVLALKAILAQTESVATIVFDEVDAGIGGSMAAVVGKKLSSLARFHQVLCITHLPQIAKFGDHHFRVSKQVAEGRTRTTIDPVTEEERVAEIARMLGGEKITRTTLNHAREMLRKKS